MEKENRKRKVNMGDFLCITVRFLSRTYHGTYDGREPEWPPSPARLFQALVAAANFGIHKKSWTESERALKWLEKRGSPQIICCRGVPGRRYISYGLNNQLDVLIGSRQRGLSLQERLPPFGVHPSSFAALPQAVAKTRQTWANYLEPISHSPTILLDENPAVHYLWPLQEEDEENAKSICRIANCLLALGWGTDMVIGEGKILNENEVNKLFGERFVPHNKENGGHKSLQVPKKGFLQRVIERFEARKIAGVFKGVPSLYTGEVTDLVWYRSLSESWGPVRWFLPFKLIHPSEDKTIAFSCWRWKEIVGWIRHAVKEKLKERKNESWIASHIMGHGSEGQHICFVPVPSVGKYGDGLVRRVMIVGQNREVEEVLREELTVDLNLVEEKTKRIVARLRPIDVKDDSYFRKFTKISRTWMTVTPVVLHGHDRRRGKFSLTKTQLLILQALNSSGYAPEKLKKLWFQKSPLVDGTRYITEFSIPSHLSKWPRYHVGIEFLDPVKGPILCGIGQHYGFGLFISHD